MIKEVFLWFEKHHVVSLVITLLIASFIFYMSSKSFEKGTLVEFPYKSIVYHFIIFFTFAFFISISIIKGKKQNNYWIFIAVLIALAYAITDEIHQLFVPNRFCDVKDFLIDSTGIILAGMIYGVRMSFTPKH